VEAKSVLVGQADRSLPSPREAETRSRAWARVNLKVDQAEPMGRLLALNRVGLVVVVEEQVPEPLDPVMELAEPAAMEVTDPLLVPEVPLQPTQRGD
jgi:hypothetical protein